MRLNRFRLAIVMSDEADGSSWYRALGPLRHLSRHAMPELDFVPLMGAGPSWAAFFNVDALFILRPHTPFSLDWIRAAKDMGVPVVLDYDDDVDNLAPEHPNFWAYHSTRQQLDEILGLATVVMVSTPALAARVAPRNSTVSVVPNAIDETLSDPAPTRELDPGFLAWRGGNTHREDLEVGRDVFTNEDYSVHYYGALPPWLRSGRDMMSPYFPVPQYLQQLRLTPAGALCVPLVDTPFNRAKSNCSWLEATWAGLACAHWTGQGMLPEFQQPGVLSLGDLREATPDTLAAARDLSLSHILDHLTLESVNPLRAEVLRGL
jgi:hypothetical protein